MLSVFPPFGRRKNEPIENGTLEDLEYYRNAALMTCGNPGKAQYHAIERERLTAIEQEIARRNQRQPPARLDETRIIQTLRATCPHCGAMIALTIQR